MPGRLTEQWTSAADCVLAVDVGSSSVRVQAYDRSAAPLLGLEPLAQFAYRWATTPDGGMEISAPALEAHVGSALDAALARVRAAGLTVRAVALTAFWHSLVGMDGEGKALTPVYSWGDTRATAAADRLHSELDAQAAHVRTGCFFHSSYPAAKLLWLRHRDPATFAAVQAWGGFPEYLFFRYFGELRYSVSMASATGLLDVHRLQWDAAVLSAAGLTAQRLPTVNAADPLFHGLRPRWAARWPELREIPWLPPLGDGACANLGSGAVGSARMALTVGTSAAVRVLWEADSLQIPTDLWAYRLDRRRWVVGGALSNGGNVFAHLQRTLSLPAPERQEQLLGTLRPDGHGLTVLPFVAGERSPGWRPHARAAVVGTTQGTTSLHLLQASLEAVAYRIGRVYHLLRRFAGEPDEIIAGGGALEASAYWTQLLSDALGRPLTLSAERETGLRGAALAALERLGVIGRLDAVPVPRGARFPPDPVRQQRYAAAAERQRSLEALLLPWLTEHPASELIDPDP